ncbi:MAG: hypothetical protein AAGH76_14740 [Pseudomonadota bacterium]
MRSVVLTALLTAASFPIATASELSYRIPDGLTYSFSETSSSDNRLTIAGGGQQGDVRQQITTTLAGQATVISTAEGRPTRLQITFSPDSATVITVNGAAETVPYNLAGQTVDVAVRGDTIASVSRSGQVVELGTKDLDALTPFVVFHHSLLPGRRVDLGDSWPAKFASQDGSTQTALTVGVTGIDATGLVALSTAGTVTHTAAGTSANGKITGTMAIDAATGLPRTSLANGTVIVASTMQQAGQTMTINGKGTLKLDRRLTPGAIAATGAVATSSSAGVGNAPTAPVGGGDQRLVGIFGGESIGGGEYGAYSNTQLKWVFNPDGRVFFGSKAHWHASERDYNQNLEWTAHGETAADTDQGTWQADGQLLTIRWSNGNVSRYAYGFEPNGALVFRNARTKKLINFYNRLR